MAADSLRIGSVWGIKISLHWTFILLMLFILLLSTINLFIVFLLLFVCVFIHELAHSRTAIRNKIRVSEIILTPIGGASMIDNPLVEPRTEFNIAIAGPTMSFLLGGIFGVAAALSPPGTLAFILQTTFELNIALGILNILPAFPLDGGRVFRSYLERRYNEFKATVITVRLSKYIAALFVIIPLVYLLLISASLAYKAFEFFIYAIVAFFLYGGAQAELQNTMLRRDTAGLTIGAAINRDFLEVSPRAKVGELYRLVERRGISIVITRIGGEFMLLDIFRRTVNGAALAEDLAVSIPQFKPNMGIIDALQRMETSGKGVAVVVRGGRPVGIVTNQHLNALISLHLLNRRQK
ncbi:MAG TPA: site-2 protease family protein [Candidatus Saccharimonadales bacterium]|nr:site-2 protease family protein [Candidatus Saccharimonadales bacterium]